ncbi:MAG: SpoIIE family protein phosphatase [Xanthomonadales bacterium]|nr:SpoIIE family protein phosphatase [Xanthomonadales bacterium]
MSDGPAVTAQRSRRFAPLIISLFAIPLGVAALALFRPILNAVDISLYDATLRWQESQQPTDPSQFVLVAIDEESIRTLGRWPWPRRTFAEVFKRTTHAEVVGVDVIFSEASNPEDDFAMAEAMREAGNVILAVGPLIDPDAEQPEGLAVGAINQTDTLFEPIPLFAEAAIGNGSIGIIEDPDGHLRRYMFVIRHAGNLIPSLAQLMAGVAAGDAGGSTQVRADGTLLINWGSLSHKAIPNYSFSDVMAMTEAEASEAFKDKTVLIGETFLGGTDIAPSPLSHRTPALLTHIYTVNTILTDQRLSKAPTWLSYLLAVGIVGLLFAQTADRHPLQLAAFGLILIALLVAAVVGIFLARGILVGPAWPALATVLFISGNGLQKWWVTNRNLRIRNVELAETLENLRRTRSAKERMEAELQIAHDIQVRMLPLTFPAFPERNEFDLYARLIPAREVGGDLYDFFFVDEHQLCLVIGDVSGKGVGASLFMALTKKLIKSTGPYQKTPEKTVQRVNRDISMDNESSMFVTLFMAVLDLQTGQMHYTNAGHNPPFIRRSDGSMERLDDRHGPVLGAVGDLPYAQSEAWMHDGDLLFMYTDGLTEAMSPKGKLFSEKRLLEALRDSDQGTAKDLVDQMEANIRAFEGGGEPTDDFTVLALRLQKTVKLQSNEFSPSD